MTKQSNVTGQASTPDYPVIFAGGTGYNRLRNDGVTQQIRKLGRTTIDALADPARFDPDFMMTINGEVSRVTRQLAYGLAHTADVSISVANFQADRAGDLLAHLEASDNPQVDAIFQSADALNGLLAALKEPSRFHTIVLAYPAGLVQPHNIKKEAPKVIMQEGLVRLKSRHRAAKRAESFERGRFGKGEGLSTIVSSVGLSKQNQLLHELRSQENSPGIAMVVGIDDIMLAPERVIASLESADDIDVMLVVDTPHGINGRTDVLRYILSLFNDVEETRNATKDGALPSLVERIRFAPGVSSERQQKILDVARSVSVKPERSLVS